MIFVYVYFLVGLIIGIFGLLLESDESQYFDLMDYIAVLFFGIFLWPIVLVARWKNDES
jgi:hypothetical protein